MGTGPHAGGRHGEHRGRAEQLLLLADRRRRGPVSGSFLTSQTVVAVRWPWMALPLAIEVLGLVLVFVTMGRRRRVAELWKDSLLAVLYHGLDREVLALHRESARTMTDIRAAAEKTTVRLLVKPSTDGGKIVLASRHG